MYSASFCQIRPAVKFARLQVLDQCRGFVWMHYAGERRHVASAIQDTKDHLLFGEAIADIGEIWSA
jgi:hypothetical protein